MLKKNYYMKKIRTIKDFLRKKTVKQTNNWDFEEWIKLKEHKRLIPLNFQKFKRNVNSAKKKIIGASQDWKCKKCKKKLEASFQVDHIIPLHKGGSNDDSNLSALCVSCHGIKTMYELALLN